MAQSEIGQETQNTTQNAKRYEKSKYKIPIFTDRNTELNKTDPKMWWEQIQQYIELTYETELEDVPENETILQNKIKADLSCHWDPKRNTKE